MFTNSNVSPNSTPVQDIRHKRYELEFDLSRSHLMMLLRLPIRVYFLIACNGMGHKPSKFEWPWLTIELLISVLKTWKGTHIPVHVHVCKRLTYICTYTYSPCKPLGSIGTAIIRHSSRMLSEASQILLKMIERAMSQHVTFHCILIGLCSVAASRLASHNIQCTL